MKKRSNLTGFKFGGLALGTPSIIEALPEKIYSISNTENNFITCSAAFGVTRNLISLHHAIKKRDKVLKKNNLDEFYDIHNDIIKRLFPSDDLYYAKAEFERIFASLKNDVNTKASYPVILGNGELASSRIFSMFLGSLGYVHTIFNARDFVKTSGSLNHANIDIEQSMKATEKMMDSKIHSGKLKLSVFQGFIGEDSLTRRPSVLPLNGSDTSGAFFAHAFDAERMVYMKDTFGVIKDMEKPCDDPSNIHHKLSHYRYLKIFSDQEEYPVHPKAIEILSYKKIPALICSVHNPTEYGTEIKS